MTLTLTQLAQFTLGAVLIVLLPGPNSLYVLSVAARRGVRSAAANSSTAWRTQATEVGPVTSR